MNNGPGELIPKNSELHRQLMARRGVIAAKLFKATFYICPKGAHCGNKLTLYISAKDHDSAANQFHLRMGGPDERDYSVMLESIEECPK